MPSRDRIGELPSHGTLAVYCQTGRRAARAVSLLEREGYRAVLVADEFENWSREEEAATAAMQ